MSGLVITWLTISHSLCESTRVHKYKKSCIWSYFDKLDRHKSFAYGRRVGRKILNTNRRILIRPNDYGDKVYLSTCANNSPYIFANFVVNYENAIEKVHTSSMKRRQNIRKFASNKIFYGELACFPLLQNTWSLGVKYWLRLCNGTKNVIEPVFPIKCGRKS